jgi:hypothetical protein
MSVVIWPLYNLGRMSVLIWPLHNLGIMYSRVRL